MEGRGGYHYENCNRKRKKEIAATKTLGVKGAVDKRDSNAKGNAEKLFTACRCQDKQDIDSAGPPWGLKIERKRSQAWAPVLKEGRIVGHKRLTEG